MPVRVLCMGNESGENIDDGKNGRLAVVLLAKCCRIRAKSIGAEKSHIYTSLESINGVDQFLHAMLF